jgi:hypothetical protein
MFVCLCFVCLYVCVSMYVYMFCMFWYTEKLRMIVAEIIFHNTIFCFFQNHQDRKVNNLRCSLYTDNHIENNDNCTSSCALQYRIKFTWKYSNYWQSEPTVISCIYTTQKFFCKHYNAVCPKWYLLPMTVLQMILTFLITEYCPSCYITNWNQYKYPNTTTPTKTWTIFKCMKVRII